MYTIKKRFARFICLTNSCFVNLDNIKVLKTKEEFIYCSGTLNGIWQYWNSFWRTYWLANILGGLDIRGNILSPISSITSNRKKENEILYFLLHILGKKKNDNGAIVGTYQEATWGDRKNIEKISLGLSQLMTSQGFNQYTSSYSNILSLIGIFGDTIDHLQIVRNATIHLDKDNVKLLKNTVVPNYLIYDIKYPTDILFAEDLSTGKVAYKNWIENLQGFMSFL